MARVRKRGCSELARGKLVGAIPHNKELFYHRAGARQAVGRDTAREARGSRDSYASSNPTMRV